MLRLLLLTALIAPLLSAQTSDQRLKDAWTHYAQFDLAGDSGEVPPAALPGAMDELGKAWAAWAEEHGPGALALPDSIAFRPSDDPDSLTPPTSRVIAHRGIWTLLGLQVPSPCGSHLFLALFKTQNRKWTLAICDLHELRSESDLLGARENVQALLLDGPEVVIASTPPWCTSCWSALRVRVLTPGTDPDHPKQLARFEDGAYRCADDDPIITLKPIKGGVQIRYTGHDPGNVGSTKRCKKNLRIP